MVRKQIYAAVAAALVTGGAATLLVALVRAPGEWWQGYVSEAGISGQPYAVAYRTGLILIALGVAALGVALRVPTAGRQSSDPQPSDPQPSGPQPAGRQPSGRQPSGRQPSGRQPSGRQPFGPRATGRWDARRWDARRWALARIAPVCLAVSAVLAATSGAVPCTDRCPLPPYEPTTVADVVHAAASILGMVLLAGAMAAVALTASQRAQRWLAAASVTLLVPLGAALGLTMLLVGRSPSGALLERLTLVVAITWLVGTALMTARRRSPVTAQPGH